MEWSKEQVVEAFLQFYASSSAASSEEHEERFKISLEETGKDEFDADDIHMVMSKFVTADFAGSLVPVIVGYLEENA